jgi:uncharacterized membrane protein YdbT with pleckstrin-like domain
MPESIKPDKKYVTKRLIVTLVSILLTVALLAGIASLIAAKEESSPAVFLAIWLVGAGIFLFFSLLSVPLTLLWVKNLNYVVLEDRITVYKGILSKTQNEIPLRAVTDFVLQRSLLDRWLGIGAILIQTAGQSPSASGFEGKLVGLRDYETLHNDLREKILGPVSPVERDFDGRKDTTVQSTLQEILSELRAIRENTARH